MQGEGGGQSGAKKTREWEEGERKMALKKDNSTHTIAVTLLGKMITHFLIPTLTKGEKKETRGHNIVADGWAVASSLHSHRMPPSHTHVLRKHLTISAIKLADF